MDIHDYRKKVRTCRPSVSTKEVLLGAIKVAHELDQSFVDPVHVELALIRSSYAPKLKEKLAKAGLTEDALYECAKAMSRYASGARARIAIERMFELAILPAERRLSNPYAGVTPQFGLGDLMYASVASGSRVIDTVIEGMHKDMFRVLAELDAPDELTLMFFPSEAAEEIERVMALG